MKRSVLLMRSAIPERGLGSPFFLAKQSPVVMPAIILVSPFVDMNVGSVSRAMLNWNLCDLRIVNPECDILSEGAKTLAVGSVELLENAKIYSTLKVCCYLLFFDSYFAGVCVCVCLCLYMYLIINLDYSNNTDNTDNNNHENHNNSNYSNKYNIAEITI